MTDFSYQLYSSRNFPPLADTLRMVADLGYAQVEGYGALYANAAAVTELQGALSDTGLAMPTAHFAIDMLRDEPDQVLKIADTLGIKAIFAPHVAPPHRPVDAAGWAAFGRELARLGAPVWDAGLQFGWHNHDFEMADLGGADRPLDLILQGDDRLTLELDVAWVQVGGQNPLDWIVKYADRLLAAHLKDIAPAGQAADEDGWADVGQGVMDWPGLMAALRHTKAQYFVMEHDNPSDHRRFAERSIAAARSF
ncbi:MAG: sugar phosphate isomerase/epimerase [Rhodobacter sp.]|nr:sugar phosphate isomerase/epimerase [Rhodobacter sp.]